MGETTPEGERLTDRRILFIKLRKCTSLVSASMCVVLHFLNLNMKLNFKSVISYKNVTKI